MCVPVCIVTSCPVLEFELRKAKETIQALRANLTQAAGVAHFSLLLHPETRPLLLLSVTDLILVPLNETGLGAHTDHHSDSVSQFLRKRNSLSGEEKPQVES